MADDYRELLDRLVLGGAGGVFIVATFLVRRCYETVTEAIRELYGCTQKLAIRIERHEEKFDNITDTLTRIEARLDGS
jgi:hypothetical protein